MYGFYKAAAVTPTIKLGDTAHNAKVIADCIAAAANSGAKLLVLPKNIVTGSSLGDLFYLNDIQDKARAAMLSIQKATEQLDILVLVGVKLEVGGTLCDCAAALYSGKILGIAALTSGINSSVLLCGEQVTVKSGLVFQAADFSVSASGDFNFLSSQKSKILAVMAAEGEVLESENRREYTAQAFSDSNNCAVIYCGAGGGESVTNEFFAGAKIIAEKGDILAMGDNLCGYNEIICEIDCARIGFIRRAQCSQNGLQNTSDGENVINFNFINEITSEILPKIEFARKINPSPFTFGGDEYYEKALRIQAAALAFRLKSSGAKKMVIGISGGLDSALALLVCLRAAKLAALKAEDIVAVTMPCFGTGSESYNAAIELIKAAGASLKIIDIKNGVSEHLAAIGHGGAPDLTYENAQARFRTLTLFDIAGTCGGLVVGTGDLSELALGWCTYGGDHLSSYSVNCGVPKTLVKALVCYEAARLKKECAASEQNYINKQKTSSGKNYINKQKTASEQNSSGFDVLNIILSADISPELLPAEGKKQKTEEIIGNYDLHDFFLYYGYMYGAGAEKLQFMAERAFKNKYSAAEIKRVLNIFCHRFVKNQFKRSCSPDGVKITTVDLSPRGGLTMPSDI